MTIALPAGEQARDDLTSSQLTAVRTTQEQPSLHESLSEFFGAAGGNRDPKDEFCSRVVEPPQGIHET